MAEKKNFPDNGEFTIEELAKIGNCEIYPENANLKLRIKNLASIERAGKLELSFLIDEKYLKFLSESEVSACIISKALIGKLDPKIILLVSDNPYKSYALIAENFYNCKESIENNLNLSYIHKNAKIGKNCIIEPFSYIGDNAIIGDNVTIRSHSYIGKDVIIGDNSHIGVGSVVRYAVIGKNVILHPGVKIGQDGFGFATDSKGHIRIPQLGKVIIEDNVDIGVNSCIDRGAISDTYIGRGTQIDNLVQIGHNVEIGKNCVIVAQVGIAGSTKIGDFTLIGGQVGIAGHLNIGSEVKIAAKSGVTKNIENSQIVAGMPAISINKWRKKNAILNSMLDEIINRKNNV